MNHEEIYKAMRSLVADSLALKEDEIQPQCRLTDDLGADSLDFIDIIFAIENLLLVAHEMRLGASGMTGPLVASDRIREILDIPPSWDIAAFIPVGFAAEEPPATGRKPAGQVTRWIE